MNRPPQTLGMRHIALWCSHLEQCLEFYTQVLGMEVEWQPDEDNYYLTSSHDNVALHRAPKDFAADAHQRLDHLGFILAKPDDVDQWYEFMQNKNVKMKNAPKTHRDGARSFYCYDPDGNTVQMIYHPPLV